jgi:hypothetical protein
MSSLQLFMRRLIERLLGVRRPGAALASDEVAFFLCHSRAPRATKAAPGRRTPRRRSVACLLIFILLLVQLPISAQRPGQGSNRPTARPAQQLIKLERSPKALLMAKAFNDGKLPEPARLPRGNVDQQAAELAKAVSVRDEFSTAALYAAVLAAGFGVRDADGSVMQTREQGQGLVINAGDLAATAKLYGEDYGVMLSHLCEAFVRGVPEWKDVSLANALLAGIRKGAKSTNPSVRFLWRFIVELGRNAEPSTDLLANVDPTKTRLDAIQISLLLNRLSGDVIALHGKTAALAKPLKNAKYSHVRRGLVKVTPANWDGPCPSDPILDLILDFTSLGATTVFGQLMDELGGKWKKYGKIAGMANVFAAVFKFILTYSLLDVKITMDGDMLERTKSSTTHGYSRTLTAKLKILPSSWEKFKCGRALLNAAGIDLEFPDSGPLSGTTVSWTLTSGGDSSGAFGSVKDMISGEDERDDIVFLKPKPGADPNPSSQSADENGISEIDVVGVKQKEDLTNRKALEVYKSAGVTVGVQIKPIKPKNLEAGLSTLSDALGIVISFLTEDPVGGGVGLIFEVLYRSNWYSADPFHFMVKDWEPCKGKWTGTMSYSMTFKEKGSAENNVNISSWNDHARYDSEIVIRGRGDDQGVRYASVTAKASMVRERISTGKGVCYRTSTQIDQLQGSERVTTTGFSVTENRRTGEYHVSAPVIVIEANGSASVDSEVKGTCNNPFNKDLHQWNPLKGKLTAEGPVVDGVGQFDPKNPDVITGTNTVTVPTNRGGERTVTIKWDLKRCQDQ